MLLYALMDRCRRGMDRNEAIGPNVPRGMDGYAAIRPNVPLETKETFS